MINKHLLFVVLIFLGNQSIAQDFAAEIRTLKGQLTAIKKDQWSANKRSITSAFDKSLRMESELKIYNTEIDRTSKILSTLLDASNPNYQIFGNKSYTDVIIDKAKTRFGTTIQGDNKTRFESILDKIANSKILKFLGANPIGSIVSTVVNTAANFLSYNRDKDGYTKDTSTPVAQPQIDNFLNDIEPIINYYNQLLSANNNFKLSLKKLSSERDKFNDVIIGSRANLLKKLKINIKSENPTIDFINLYDDTKDEYQTYADLVDNINIKDAIPDALKLNDTEVLFEQYKTNYREAVGKLTQESITALASAKKYAQNNGQSTNTIDALIDQLNNPTDSKDPATKAIKDYKQTELEFKEKLKTNNDLKN